MKPSELRSMTIDQLWELHETVAALLSVKITAEKRELEQRLRQINQLSGVRPREDGRQPYPRVLPKYRNPLLPSETWSGRGKRPRWMTQQLKSGRNLDDFRIGQDELRALQSSPTLVP